MAEPYFHLAGPILEPGSIIAPGNWGRIVRRLGWAHAFALREMALEEARILRFPDRPSRLEAAFVSPTIEEANRFRFIQGQVTGFEHHCLYRVKLLNPEALTFTTDHRLVTPSGLLRPDWADVYWRGLDPQGIPGPIPGIDHATMLADNTGPYREILTLSHLVVEERLDPP